MRRLLATTAGLALATSLQAQPLPDTDALGAQLARSLPGYWQVNDFAVVATTQAGDAMRPRAYVRFEAGTAPAADLHLESGSEGPFAVLTRTVEEGAERRLFGVFDLTYAAGSWNGEPLIENPVTGLGQPRDMFARPTLVLGDPEAEAMLAALRTDTMANAAAALEREVAALRNDQAMELTRLEIAHAEALASLRTRNAEALAEADEAFKTERAALERQHREELARLTTEATPRLAEAQAELERQLAAAQATADAALRAQQEAQTQELQDLAAAHAERRNALVARQEAEIAELAGAEAQRAQELAAARLATAEALRAVQEQDEAELDDLRANHAQVRGELIARLRQELAGFETGLATERRVLERQVENAQTVMALQQTLLAAFEEREAQGNQLFEAFELERRQRIAFLGQLPRNWVGQAECREQGGQQRVWVTPSRFCWFEATSNGFLGNLIHGGNSSEACPATGYPFVTVAATMEIFSFPLDLRAVAASEIEWLGGRFIDLSVSDSGRMSGSAERTWRINNIQTPVQCSYNLAAR